MTVIFRSAISSIGHNSFWNKYSKMQFPLYLSGPLREFSQVSYSQKLIVQLSMYSSQQKESF